MVLHIESYHRCALRPDSKLVIALPTSMSARPQSVAGIPTG
jgi:hypothetical protein